ncbi:MAG: superinfection immunity protein [Ruminococcaceae bacterium]|nr:superinfection immunity protein [Oscillospiraceae bacterium]
MNILVFLFYVVSVFLVIALGVCIFMLPSLIAIIRKHNKTRVILFNIFLGWTFVMWIFCMIWACSRKEQKEVH